jgi:hypothetical protein
MSTTKAALEAVAKAHAVARHAASEARPIEEETPVTTRISTLHEDGAETATARETARSSFWRSDTLPIGLGIIMLLVLLYFALVVK